MIPTEYVLSETLRVFGQLDAVKSTSKEYGQKVETWDYSLIRVITKIFFKTAQVLINYSSTGTSSTKPKALPALVL